VQTIEKTEEHILLAMALSFTQNLQLTQAGTMTRIINGVDTEQFRPKSAVAASVPKGHFDLL
jgi:hypothetical protein